MTIKTVTGQHLLGTFEMNFGIGYSLLSGFLQSDIYYIICLAAYAVLFVCPFVFIMLRRHAWLYITFMVTAFIAVKLLSLCIAQQNPDEGQHLLMAYSLIDGGVPFRDFEGQGNGPLNALYLALFSFGGISFFTAHLAALFAEIACGAMSFFAVRKLCGSRPAIALSGLVFFYFSIYLFDVTAYNNETLFCMLISFWLLLYAYRNGRGIMLFAECFVLGLLPWVKLQFAPFTVCCLVLSIARGVFRPDSRMCSTGTAIAELDDITESRGSCRKWPTILKDTLTASAGAAVPTVLFLAYLALNGALEPFWLFYIRVNVEHVSVSFPEYLSSLPKSLVLFADISLFPIPVSAAVTFVILELADHIKNKRRITGRGLSVLALLAFFTLTAYFASTRTMSLFDHYINILVPSCVILVAMGLAVSSDEDIRRNSALAILALAAGFSIYKMMTVDYIHNIRTIQKDGFVRESEYPYRDVLKYLNSHVSPGEPIAIWGWETGFPIYSNHPSATATHFLYPLVDKKFDKNLQDELRSRYAADIIKNKPAAIVDMACPAAFKYWDSRYYLEKYQFIKSIADKYYETPVTFPVAATAPFGGGIAPWLDSDSTAFKDGAVRLYLRKNADSR